MASQAAHGAGDGALRRRSAFGSSGRHLRDMESFLRDLLRPPRRSLRPVRISPPARAAAAAAAAPPGARVCRESQAVMLCACMQYGWQMRGTRERARVACMSMCECVDFCHLTLEPLYD